MDNKKHKVDEELLIGIRKDNGHQVRGLLVSWHINSGEYEIRSNNPFEATLVLDMFVSGYKAVFCDKENSFDYFMFFSDFTDLVKSMDLSVPISGTWAFRKQGKQIGIFLLSLSGNKT